MVVAKGYDGWEGHDFQRCVFSDEDEKFVEALREVQPYIFLHRGTTFVVVIAGEIVASPYLLDALLQVIAAFSISLGLSLTHSAAHILGKNILRY